MTRADAALYAACEWLERHRRITCALLCAAILAVGYLDAPR